MEGERSGPLCHTHGHCQMMAFSSYQGTLSQYITSQKYTQNPLGKGLGTNKTDQEFYFGMIKEDPEKEMILMMC